MKARRKVCINSNEIQSAINMNNQIKYESGGSGFCPQIAIPDPEYALCNFNFRIHNCQSFYTEVNSDGRAGDIIVNMVYDGIVRFEYCPALEAKLETFFSD